jgi:hypothetical protein
MNTITGREIPWEIGLADPLARPDDTGASQPKEYQSGVQRILKILADSDRPVSIVTIGSVRDVAAAFNRSPDLFHKKLGRLMIFIGEASDPGFIEYNVSLDVQAFRRIMESGLPVYWVPCFDGGLWQNRGHASFWRASHRTLLEGASPDVIQYFIYALEKEPAEPLAFLSRPVEPECQARLFAGTRNLWCTAVLGVMSGREVVFNGSKWTCLLPEPGLTAAVARRKPLFGFSKVRVSISDVGVVSYGKGPGSHKVRRFEVRDTAQYEQGMVEATATLLSSLGRTGERDAR